MGKVTVHFVLGGARSGKSSYAELLAKQTAQALGQPCIMWGLPRP